ncbi:hypothetical protein Tco_0733005 [Tanacetum coccineum]
MDVLSASYAARGKSIVSILIDLLPACLNVLPELDFLSLDSRGSGSCCFCAEVVVVVVFGMANEIGRIESRHGIAASRGRIGEMTEVSCWIEMDTIDSASVSAIRRQCPCGALLVVIGLEASVISTFECSRFGPARTLGVESVSLPDKPSSAYKDVESSRPDVSVGT